jgi:long-chain acyl-CoA synthetase
VSLLYEILEDNANHNPDHIALVYETHQITYQTLKDAVDKLAAGIKNLGLKAGDRIAVMLPNIPHFPIAFFALSKLGITIVPIPILYKSDEIHHQLEDSEVKGVIYWDGFRSSVNQAIQDLEQCRHRIVLGDTANPGEVRLTFLIEANEPLLESADNSPEETALIVYTAGTTGLPKGAELTHQNIISNAEACLKFFKISSQDSVLSAIPMNYPLGFTLSLCTFIYVGGKVILKTKFEAADILKSIGQNKPTFLMCVPSMIKTLLEAEKPDELDVSSVKYCISSGDVLKLEVIDAFRKKLQLQIFAGKAGGIYWSASARRRD